MRDLNFLITLCAALFFAVYAIAQENQKNKKPAKPALNIPNFYCPIENKVGTGGQPSAQALAEAAEQGYKSVLNLRTANEGVDLKAEEAQVKGLGMRYFNVPVKSGDPKDEEVPQVLKILRDENNYPILIHCGSGSRVGAFWMIHRVLDDHWSLDRAEEEASKIGLKHTNLREFARQYLQRHKGDK
jgi:uncharacterized protein (TIGR01244 family)